MPHGFQLEDYHLSAENPNYKCNPGKPRAGFYICLIQYVQILAFNIQPYLHPTEPPGAFLQAAELCHPVWHVQSFLPRRTMRTVLQSLQQGTHECVYMTFL